MTDMNLQHQPILLTGCYRSGTTLLDKLLHGHPEILMVSQAYPVLFYYVKQQFLNEKGLERRYPLEHLFLEDGYTPDEFSRFLDRFVLDDRHLDEMFKQMASFTAGVWTPEWMEYQSDVHPGTFWDVLCQLNEQIVKVFPRENAFYLGSKEPMTEEYIPYLLEKGAKIVLIIRDPRDIITSVNYSQKSHMGDSRPVLYTLRAWRKSVAFALGCESDPGFAWLTYEDLVKNTWSTLDAMTKNLGIDAYLDDVFSDGIRDQHGKLWKSNSSFEAISGIDVTALGRFSTCLPHEVIAYIEAACYPELKVLGYDFKLLQKFESKALTEYREPFSVLHDKFVSQVEYSSDPKRISDECKRIEKVFDNEPDISDEELQRWFIHPAAYHRLREAIQ